jgi:hypothetical protein
MEITIDEALPDNLRTALAAESDYGISKLCDIAYKMGKDRSGHDIIIADIKDPFGDPLKVDLAPEEVENGKFRDRIHSAWGDAVSSGLQKKLSDLSQRHGSHMANAIAEIEKFRKSLRMLYDVFRAALKPHTDSGMITVDIGEKTIQEPRLPPYDVPVLIISIPGGKIKLDPKGIVLIGSRGRVDMKGPGGELMMVLQDDKWMFVVRSPRFLQWTVTVQSVQEAISLVSG